MRTFYIHDGHHEIGPFTLEELKNQKLSKSTPIWHEGLTSWTTVENIEELSSVSNTPPPFQGSFKTSPPPYTKSYSSYPLPEEKKSFSVKTVTITVALITIVLIAWMISNNNSQAAAVEAVQIQQQNLIDEKQSQDEERRRINEQLTIKNRNYRNNWPDFIKAGNSNYHYSKLGGIYGLEVIVYNKTDYMLDEVIITVSYVKANGDLWKTVEVPVYNVPAKSEKRMPAADVERGTAVDVGINSITSKKMHFCYVPGNWANSSEDPYFCK